MKGFTLVELLIAAILIVVVSTVTTSIITTSLRSASKTTLSSTIRQSGSYITEQIVDFVRYATQFNGVKALSTDAYTTYCANPATQYHYLSLTTSTNTQVIFYCGASVSPSVTPPIASNGASLIDTTAISVSNCYFTCSQTSNSSPPIIGIYFTLSQAGSSNFSENNVSLPFSDSAFMRNVTY